MIHERLEDDEVTGRDGHECRYRIAAGFIRPGDVVLDAACGTGYGRQFLPTECEWVGVDRAPGGGIVADLTTWVPDFDFDVAVAFETLEHLDEFTHFVGILKQARRWILASVPVIPTVGMNPWHRHDLVYGALQELIVDAHWALYQRFWQPSEFSEVGVFHRRG